MKVVIITGSVRTGRQTQKAAQYLQKELEIRAIETAIIDLAEYSLPIMEERISRNPEAPSAALEISEKLKAADAIVLVTPEYHGSFSGVLKNALDYFGPEFSKKVVGVVTVSGGRMGGINASVQLQHVILSMGAFPLPQKLLVGEIQNAFDDALNPQTELLGKQAAKFIEEFTWFAEAIRVAKKITEKKELV